MAKDDYIVQFNSLKKTLKNLGIVVYRKGNAWREIKSEDIQIDELNK